MPLGALLLAACTSGSIARQAQAPAQPNIVLMVVEDLGPRVGAFGDELAKTPTLDTLASEGLRFTRVFTTAGVCAPSRAALISGMHQASIGAQHMRTRTFGRTRSGEFGTASTPGPPYETVPPPYVKAFPERLRAAGYFTMNNVKTDYQFGEPFTVWDLHSENASVSDLVDRQPFFAMYSNNDTHESGLFRQPWADKLERAPALAERNQKRLAVLDERIDPAAVKVPAYLPDTPAVRGEVARQYDNIRLMDRWVDERIAELAAAGLLDNTIIIWTTDHGDGFPRAKRSIYDSGLHVPMIVRFPDRRRAGETVDELVSFVDLAPTILSLAGAPVPAHLHGRDIFDPQSPSRRYVYAARDRLDEWPDRSRAVRDDRYKYIRNFDAERPFFRPLYYRENLASMAELRRLRDEGQLPPVLAAYFETPRPLEELYDTARDPDELVNLAGDARHRDTLERMRAALDDWLARVGDLATLSESAMVDGMWPGGVQPATPAPIAGTDCTSGEVRIEMPAGFRNASIEYRRTGARHDGWRLYTGPLLIEPGERLEARAIRYGYEPSPLVAAKAHCP